MKKEEPELTYNEFKRAQQENELQKRRIVVLKSNISTLNKIKEIISE